MKNRKIKLEPNGFVAKCQCGHYVGALSLSGTPAQETSRILGKWLFSGCTVEPKFTPNWTQEITPCACNSTKE